MRLDFTIPTRMLSALATVLAATLFLAAGDTSGADDKPVEIPDGYRGTWVLRLTSDDGGKTYKSGGGQAICVVSEKEIKFARKVDFSDGKLVVKSVTKSDGKGPPTYLIGFENGKVWRLSESSGSITAIIHDSEKEKLTETYRITVRKQAK